MFFGNFFRDEVDHFSAIDDGERFTRFVTNDITVNTKCFKAVVPRCLGRNRSSLLPQGCPYVSENLQGN